MEYYPEMGTINTIRVGLISDTHGLLRKEAIAALSSSPATGSTPVSLP